MEKGSKIWVIDGKAESCEQTASLLSDEGYLVSTYSDGQSALQYLHLPDPASRSLPDVIILDSALPDMTGYHLCKELRSLIQVPILMLNNGVDPYDEVLGLDLGADDFMRRPFIPMILRARIKALLRRSSTVRHGSAGEHCVTYPELSVNLNNYQVTCMGHAIDMPPKELELLYFLAASPNQVFTREQLLDHLWGYDYIGDIRTVDVHVKRLREKLPPNKHWALVTVWGVGYKFELL